MSSPSPTELELVRGLHARDRKALARVYGDHHAGVYNLCARILGDREEAQDVTQDVFLKAFSSPPAATEDVRLRPWLYRVATNACLSLIRDRRACDPIEVETIPAGGDPYEQAHTVALIESSLAGINERYRAALVLKDLHGLDGRELAEVLEVSRPAADVLVHRARASFRRVFAGLAGSDATAPASLAIALPVLAVPAALQALPLPGHTSGPLGAWAAPAAGAAAASGAGPAIGLIAKIGAALSTKAVVIAAGAAVVAGGGIAAVELAGSGTAPAPASAGGGAGAPVQRAGATGGTHDGSGWAEHRRVIADHLASSHHAGEGIHHTAGHDGSHDGAGSGTHHAASSSHTSSHDSTTHDAMTTSASSSSPTTGTHDSGETGHDAGHDAAVH